jgi:hypothetical protein
MELLPYGRLAANKYKNQKNNKAFCEQKRA